MTDIAVNTEFLAKCLGLEKWPDWEFPGSPEGPAYLSNWQRRYAARAITDALRADPTGKVHADIAIHNAAAWIARAYEQGALEGIRQEREKWERKIREMFELPEAHG